MAVFEPINAVQQKARLRSVNWRAWLMALMVLAACSAAAIAALVNYLQTNWQPQRLEKLIGETIHRRVHLGSVKWGWAVDGLSFSTSQLKIQELDGKEFIEAGPTSISLALTPLMRGQFYPKDLEIAHPQVWAVRKSKTTWNFSDLPAVDASKYIAHLGCHSGCLHIIDPYSPLPKANQTMAMSDIEFKLDRPLGNFYWPYHLSCNIPRSKLNTHIDLAGSGSGDLSQWRHKHYTVDAQVDRFDPKDLALLGLVPPEVAAPVKLSCKGAGEASEGFTVSLSFENPQLTATLQKLEYKGDLIDRLITLTRQAAAAGEKPPVFNLASLAGTVSWQEATVRWLKEKIGFDHCQGKVACKNGTITAERIAGNIAKGNFQIKGQVQPDNDCKGDLDIQTMNFETVKQLLKFVNFKAMEGQTELISGTLKSAHVALKQQKGKLTYKIDAQPAGLYFQSPGEARIVTVSGGQLHFDGNTYQLEDVKGTLGLGSFLIKGTAGVPRKSPLSLVANASKIDLDHARKLLAALKIQLPETAADRMQGQVQSADLKITGQVGQPQMALKAQISDIYVQDKAKTRIFNLSGGTVQFDNNVVTLDKLIGHIGKGEFDLSGRAVMSNPPTLDVGIKARNLDISNAKVVLEDLKLESPLLAEQLLAGVVKTLDLTIEGNVNQPSMTMYATPQDILFEPLGSDRPLHIQDGRISYDHDTLDMDEVQIKTDKSNLKVSLSVNNLSQKNSLVSKLLIHSPGMDLSDLGSFLGAKKTPPVVRDQYISLLQRNLIESPSGQLSGYFVYNAKKGAAASSKGKMKAQSLAATIAGFPIEDVNGVVTETDNVLSLSQMQGRLGQTRFNLTGKINDVSNADIRKYDIRVSCQVALDDMLKQLGWKAELAQVSAKPISFQGNLTGTEGARILSFTAQADKQTPVTIKTALGNITKAAGMEAAIHGQAAIRTGHFALKDTQLKVGNMAINCSGTYDDPVSNSQSVPQIDFLFFTPEFTSVQEFAAMVPTTPNDNLDNAAGTFRGGIHIRGPIDDPSIKCGLRLNEVSIPKLDLSKVTGVIRAPDWFNPPGPGSQVIEGTLNFDFPSLYLHKLPVANVRGTIKPADDRNYEVLLNANLAKGAVAVSGQLNVQGDARCHVKLTDIDTSQLAVGLPVSAREVDGIMQAEADLLTSGKNLDFMKTASAAGNFSIANGHLRQMALLQKKINQANLLKGGLLGFNLNNVMSSLGSGDSGQFKNVSVHFDLKAGVLTLPAISFVGDDLTVQSKGTVDLVHDKLRLQAFGSIPRVSKDGPFGAVAPFMGVNLLRDAIAEIPSVLSSGKENEAKQNDRSFAFGATGPLSNMNAIADSIYKSFRWLPTTATSSPES